MDGETAVTPAEAESKMIMERLLLSPDQVAESLGVCRSRVYDLMRTRVLPSVKSQVLLIGRRSASYLGFAQWELATATSRNGGSR